MVIESYLAGPEPVYERAAQRGRMLPDGLRYIASWIVATGERDRCFQLMECDPVDADTLLQKWIANWSDLVAFEVHPVVSSAEAAGEAGIRWVPDTD